MVRTMEDIVKTQIGSLILQIAQLTAENDILKAELIAATELIEKKQENVSTK